MKISPWLPAGAVLWYLTTMQLEIKTKSGRVYKRVAWMGGDSAPLNIAEINEDWACLYSFFYREQMVDYIYFFLFLLYFLLKYKVFIFLG